MQPIKVVVTGAAGQIAYSLLPRLTSGEVFGNRPIDLRLVEVPPAMERLSGTVLELEDCGSPHIASITATADLAAACDGADWAVLLGSAPRGIVINGKKIVERADLLGVNGGIFQQQGAVIGRTASPNAKVLVVGNPANTNALIGAHHAKQPSQTWMAMTMLDALRARHQIAKKAGADVGDVSRICIWGNHSPTMVPDMVNARVGTSSAYDAIGQDQSWVEDTFFPTVQQRGAAIIAARGASSAASAANAALVTMQQCEGKTPAGDCFSVALMVTEHGTHYGIPSGIVCGLPVVSDGHGTLSVASDFEIQPWLQSRVDASVKELQQEKEMVAHLFS